MYYTKQPGFRSCITDISIYKSSFASIYRQSSSSPNPPFLVPGWKLSQPGAGEGDMELILTPVPQLGSNGEPPGAS